MRELVVRTRSRLHPSVDRMQWSLVSESVHVVRLDHCRSCCADHDASGDCDGEAGGDSVECRNEDQRTGDRIRCLSVL